MWGKRTANLNSPAPSAHAAPSQTYAAPRHVQWGQTVAEAWVTKPTLWRAYPGPVATLVWTSLKKDERGEEQMQKENREKEDIGKQDIKIKRK